MQDLCEEEHTEILARVVDGRRRPSVLWLIGAGLAFAVAAVITAFGQTTHAVSPATMQALEREASEIGHAVDAAAGAAHRRADGVASTAMVRAAVLTDAATVADVMHSELELGLAPGEIVELHQIHDGALEPLIRIPAAAPALPKIRDRAVTLVQLDGNNLRVVVGAHVERLKDGAGYDATKAGMFVLSVPVDLAAIRRRLADHAVDATLAESGPSIHLVSQLAVAAGDLVRIAVPARTATLTLTAAPQLTSARVRWIDIARDAVFGLGAVTLIGFAVIAVSRGRRRAAADRSQR